MEAILHIVCVEGGVEKLPIVCLVWLKMGRYCSNS